ncbi:MAG: hypothetical protein ACFFDF_13850 [Candidatus Odinarchaeota archaeon]
MSYEQSKSTIRDLALIRSITLLENVIKRLDSETTKIETVVNDWEKSGSLELRNKIKILVGTSADRPACRFLVYCMNKLDKHLRSEFPQTDYIKMLVDDCLWALDNAIVGHSHIWNTVQIHSILSGLGSASIEKTKGLPFYDVDDKKEKRRKRQKQPLSSDIV